MGRVKSMLERFTGAGGQSTVVAALRNQPLIGNDDTLADTIAKVSEIAGFKPGDTIIEEAAPDDAVHFVLAGTVSVRVLNREIAVRSAGQHVGEMALVDPGQPRSASVIALDEVVTACLSASEFSNLAEANSKLWRNVARELAARLRQRNRFVTPTNPRPVLFIGCSAESLSVACAIQSGLAYDPVVVTLWTDGVFRASSFAIESLERELDKADFAALILSSDDRVTSRDVTSDAPRDNIIFELGLFMGALGRKRTFLVHPREVNLKIPTDLFGIIPLTYELGAGDDILSSVAPACNELRALIKEAGPR